MNVAVYGGSFNPPHIAHVLAAVLVRKTRDIDRVLVVPTFVHAFGKALAPFDARFEMCKLSMAGIEGVEVSAIERDIGGQSRTLRTLERLCAEHPDWNLRLVIGSDVLSEANRWFGFDEIVRIAPPLVLGRAGLPSGYAPSLLPDVSSTKIRQLVAEAAWDELSNLVSRDVLAYIRSHHLYE